MVCVGFLKDAQQLCEDAAAEADASDVVPAYESSADAAVSAGQTLGLDIHIVSSTSASVLLGKVVDARTLYPDASELHEGHSTTGGDANFETIWHRKQMLQVLSCWVVPSAAYGVRVC